MNNPLFPKSLSTVSINSFKSGIWQITFEAHITSVVPINFVKLLTLFKLKKLFWVLTLFFMAVSATFFEGSKPIYSISDFLKLLKNVPSFEPISINLKLELKKLF